MAGPGDDNNVLIYQGNSRLGFLMPDIVIEEVMEDRLQITMHPIEGGGQIADHAFNLPKTVDMKIGWADYKAGVIGSSTQKYEQILRMQARREPFEISTGKRIYKNMLPESITVMNDQRTKFAVLPVIRFREVRTTESREINLQTRTTAAQSTVPPANTGGGGAPREVSRQDVPAIEILPPDARASVLPEVPPPI